MPGGRAIEMTDDAPSGRAYYPPMPKQVPEDTIARGPHQADRSDARPGGAAPGSSAGSPGPSPRSPPPVGRRGRVFVLGGLQRKALAAALALKEAGLHNVSMPSSYASLGFGAPSTSSSQSIQPSTIILHIRPPLLSSPLSIYPSSSHTPLPAPPTILLSSHPIKYIPLHLLSPIPKQLIHSPSHQHLIPPPRAAPGSSARSPEPVTGQFAAPFGRRGQVFVLPASCRKGPGRRPRPERGRASCHRG